MALVTVEVADLSAAARELSRSVGDPLAALVGDALGGVLAGGGMAGDDPAGVQWSGGYDRAAPLAIQAAEDVINSCYRVSAMLGATARNYARAEAASTVRGHRVDPRMTAATAALPDDTRIGLPSSVPSAAAGAGDPDLPFGWHFVAHHLGGYVWPNGHQDRLRRAATAWRTSAAALEDHAATAVFVDLTPLVDGLREGPDIATVCNALGEQLRAVARAHRGLAHACSELAGHIDHAHSRVEHELLELAAWTGGIQTVGALASIFTAGTAEAPTQAGQAARIAATASAVAGILRDFVLAVRAIAAEIGPIADTVASVRTAVAWLKDLRIVEVEVTAVPGLRVYQVARIERAGKRVVTAKELQEESAALRLTEKPVTGRTRWAKPSTLRRHFNDHGREVGCSTVDEYADAAAAFYDRSIAERLPTKIDDLGDVRIYDPKTNTFGSYTKDGFARTLYKPSGGLRYWQRQPGELQ